MSQSLELDPLLVKPLRKPDAPTRRRQPKQYLRARASVVRIALAIVIGVTVLAFAGRMIGFAIQPVLATYRTGQEIQTLERDLVRQVAIKKQLEDDIAYLKTTAGVEQQARRVGWVKPREVALAMLEPESPAPPVEPGVKPGTKPAPAAKQPEKPKQFATQMREAIDTCLAVFGGGRRTPK